MHNCSEWWTSEYDGCKAECGVTATCKELWSCDVSWYSDLEASQWLMHVSSVLSVVNTIVNDFVDSGKSVILQGYHYWSLFIKAEKDVGCDIRQLEKVFLKTVCLICQLLQHLCSYSIAEVSRFIFSVMSYCRCNVGGEQG